jgi:uncharacterized membrane protein
MPGIAVGLLVLALVAAVVGGSVAIGAPLLAIPLVFAILVVWGGARLASRRASDGTDGIDLTERDRRTLTSSDR